MYDEILELPNLFEINLFRLVAEGVSYLSLDGKVTKDQDCES